jgi:hypothetical protein
MSIYETYSERQRRFQQGATPDVYKYDRIPEKLRVQIVHIMNDGFGSYFEASGKKNWNYLENQIARSEGVPRLAPTNFTSQQACERWITDSGRRVDQILSMTEIAALMIDVGGKSELIAELNHRFRQNSVGYQFEGGQFIRVDSQFLHAEVVKPAIGHLASNPAYKTASDEFMAAHKHYRDGSNQDAVVAANRAFESTLKAICNIHDWPYGAGARASDLIKVVRTNGLFPDYLDKTFDTYIATMKSGLPGVRNSAGGHGGAPGDPKVPNYLAAYAIHLSAANIVLAIEAANA